MGRAVRLVVTGNGGIEDYDFVKRCLECVEREWVITRIISGNRLGVEAHALRWALENDYPSTIMYPKTKRCLHQIKCMLQYGDSLLVLGDFSALLNQYYIYEATKRGLFIRVISYDN